MLRRAHPHGAPPELAALLERVRGAVGQIQLYRSEGLILQRKLDAIESDARETRARLGYAMQRLGEALSHAREAMRQAEAETSPYIAAANEAEAAFRGACRELAARGPLEQLPEPSLGFLGELRQVGQATERWLAAYETGVRAKEYVGTRAAELADFDFQVQALRDQLARVEADAEGARASFQSDLAARTRDVEGLQQQLLAHGSELVEALRPRAELGDLFVRLEREGGG